MAKLFSYFNDGIDTVCDLFIRPPRFKYNISDLGSQDFLIDGQRVLREDFSVKTKRNAILQCSFYKPITQQNRQKQQYPCVIYLHGNSGNRKNGQFLKRYLLPQKIGLITFDQHGSGISQGENISLGWFENQDMAQVMKRIFQFTCIQKDKIAIWGYSMGAVTAILYQSMAKKYKVQLLVLDSPFSNLEKLTKYQIKQKTGLPDFLVSPVLALISDKIEKKGNFLIKWVAPDKYIKKIKIPVFFIHGTKDKLVPCQNSKILHRIYNQQNSGCSRKQSQIELANISHNDFRPRHLVQKAVNFLLRNLLKKSDLKIVQKNIQNMENFQQMQKLQQLKSSTVFLNKSPKEYQRQKQMQNSAQKIKNRLVHGNEQNLKNQQTKTQQYRVQINQSKHVKSNEKMKYLKRTKSKAKILKVKNNNQNLQGIEKNWNHRESSHLPIRSSHQYPHMNQPNITQQPQSFNQFTTNPQSFNLQSSFTFGQSTKNNNNIEITPVIGNHMQISIDHSKNKFQTTTSTSSSNFNNTIKKAQICLNNYKNFPLENHQQNTTEKINNPQKNPCIDFTKYDLKKNHPTLAPSASSKNLKDLRRDTFNQPRKNLLHQRHKISKSINLSQSQVVTQKHINQSHHQQQHIFVTPLKRQLKREPIIKQQILSSYESSMKSRHQQHSILNQTNANTKSFLLSSSQIQVKSNNFIQKTPQPTTKMTKRRLGSHRQKYTQIQQNNQTKPKLSKKTKILLHRSSSVQKLGFESSVNTVPLKQSPARRRKNLRRSLKKFNTRKDIRLIQFQLQKMDDVKMKKAQNNDQKNLIINSNHHMSKSLKNTQKFTVDIQSRKRRSNNYTVLVTPRTSKGPNHNSSNLQHHHHYEQQQRQDQQEQFKQQQQSYLRVECSTSNQPNTQIEQPQYQRPPPPSVKAIDVQKRKSSKSHFIQKHSQLHQSEVYTCMPKSYQHQNKKHKENCLQKPSSSILPQRNQSMNYLQTTTFSQMTQNHQLKQLQQQQREYRKLNQKLEEYKRLYNSPPSSSLSNKSKNYVKKKKTTVKQAQSAQKNRYVWKKLNIHDEEKNVDMDTQGGRNIGQNGSQRNIQPHHQLEGKSLSRMLLKKQNTKVQSKYQESTLKKPKILQLSKSGSMKNILSTGPSSTIDFSSIQNNHNNDQISQQQSTTSTSKRINNFSKRTSCVYRQKLPQFSLKDELSNQTQYGRSSVSKKKKRCYRRYSSSRNSKDLYQQVSDLHHHQSQNDRKLKNLFKNNYSGTKSKNPMQQQSLMNIHLQQAKVGSNDESQTIHHQGSTVANRSTNGILKQYFRKSNNFNQKSINTTTTIASNITQIDNQSLLAQKQKFEKTKDVWRKCIKESKLGHYQKKIDSKAFMRKRSING